MSEAGSIRAGTSMVARALLIVSLRELCRESLPELLRQERPCNPRESTSFPHGHLCSKHSGAPSRRPTVIYAVKLTVSTEKMISLIKGRSCIWDRMDAGYRDKFCREKAWSDIYKELYPTFDNLKEGQKIRIGQQISKKWFNIRDAYVKSIYSQAMSFLDPVILGERQDAQDFLEDQSFEDEPEIWLNEASFIDMDTNEPQMKKAKHEANNYLESAENDAVVAIFSKMINREEDEDRAFFTSITPTVKGLSENAKLEFRIQVMKLLKKLKTDTNNGMVIKTNESDSE